MTAEQIYTYLLVAVEDYDESLHKGPFQRTGYEAKISAGTLVYWINVPEGAVEAGKDAVLRALAQHMSSTQWSRMTRLLLGLPEPLTVTVSRGWGS